MILAAPLYAKSHRLNWHQLTTVERQTVVRREIHRDRTAIHWWVNRRQRLQASSQRRYAVCSIIGIRSPSAICRAGTRLRSALPVEARIEARIAAAVEAVRMRALVRRHLDGWVCIHGREGAWNASTGNGFYGGLQMTFGWAGRVGDASRLSPAQQIAAAEAEAAEHGWSWTWMHGQWPNTFPPCAGYFS